MLSAIAKLEISAFSIGATNESYLVYVKVFEVFSKTLIKLAVCVNLACTFAD